MGVGEVFCDGTSHHLILLVVLCFSAPLQAKEWARKMFDPNGDGVPDLFHDFGTVARGAKAEFEFDLQNIYKEEVHIASVRSSCGCTTPSIINPTLQTWDTGKILAKFNSRSFLGQKSATITVTIDRPYAAEVQLTVSGYIRSDVVLHPGSVDVGEIDAGSSSVQVIDINYAGRNDWRIVGMEIPNKNVKVQLRETRREMSPGAARVSYQMQVTLSKDAPVGYVTDQFYIVTNDQQMRKIPVAMSGRVLPSVTVSPASLALGVLEPGEKITKQLLVKSKRPFQVTDVACEGDCLTFESPAGAKMLHRIPVTFTAGDEPGTLAMDIRIMTDLGAVRWPNARPRHPFANPLAVSVVLLAARRAVAARPVPSIFVPIGDFTLPPGPCCLHSHTGNMVSTPPHLGRAIRVVDVTLFIGTGLNRTKTEWSHVSLSGMSLAFSVSDGCGQTLFSIGTSPPATLLKTPNCEHATVLKATPTATERCWSSCGWRVRHGSPQPVTGETSTNWPLLPSRR